MLKILIVDDEPDNRMILKEVFAREGYAIHEAADGLTALSLAPAVKPDAILLDLTMPKLDGWEVARRLKASPELREIPVIALTAHALAGDAQKALAAGCDDCLSKPCLPREVLERVQRWVARKEAVVKAEGAGGAR